MASEKKKYTIEYSQQTLTMKKFQKTKLNTNFTKPTHNNDDPKT